MLSSGTRVRFKSSSGMPTDIEEGVVVGYITVAQPIIGNTYAVDVGFRISEEYPYPVVGVFECHLEVIE